MLFVLVAFTDRSQCTYTDGAKGEHYMIFITVGSQKFQFNRLLKAVDGLVASGVIDEEVFAQTGYSDYKPEHYAYKDFLNHEEFSEYEDRADIVITHGGTGAIIGAVKQGKKVIAVPRLARYGEHVDDHQTQLIGQFKKQNLISGISGIDNLEKALSFARNHTFDTYISNTYRIIDSIDKYIVSEVTK